MFTQNPNLTHRFTKTNRLLTKCEYSDVFNKGKRLYSHTFCLFYRSNLGSEARLGIVVGKNKIPKAVDRNTFKRLMREFFRVHKEGLQGLDIVILCKRKPDPSQSIQQFREELKKLWLRLPRGLKKA